jgi:hypothetical protein
MDTILALTMNIYLLTMGIRGQKFRNYRYLNEHEPNITHKPAGTFTDYHDVKCQNNDNKM